jgi:hypothetical protein
MTLSAAAAGVLEHRDHTSFELITQDTEGQGLEPPQNAFTDVRPTKRYQTLLLLSGFMMIFHVIGINQIFGVFQVRVCRHIILLPATGRLNSFLRVVMLGLLYLTGEQHTRCYWPRCARFARWHNRRWANMGGEHLRQPMDGTHPERPYHHSSGGVLYEPRTLSCKFQYKGQCSRSVVIC